MRNRARKIYRENRKSWGRQHDEVHLEEHSDDVEAREEKQRKKELERE